jgi:hypothetical protein
MTDFELFKGDRIETDNYIQISDVESTLTILKDPAVFEQAQYYLQFGVFEYRDVSVKEIESCAFTGQTVHVSTATQPCTPYEVRVDGETAYTAVADKNGTVSINTSSSGSGTYQLTQGSTVLVEFVVQDVQSFTPEEVAEPIMRELNRAISETVHFDQFCSTEAQTAYWNDDELPEHIKNHINQVAHLDHRKLDTEISPE